MPLFDPNDIKSAEVGALWHLADLLTECESVQELSEATGSNDAELKASARTRFILGPHAGPWDADEFTVEELEARFIEFQLYLPTEGGRTVVKSDGTFDRADEGGEVMLITRRLIRIGELGSFNDGATLDGRQDAYVFFADRISWMEQEAMTLAESRDRPTLRAFTRQQGPSIGEKKTETAQGAFIQTLHSITWGDPIEQ